MALLERKLQPHDAEMVFNLALSNLWEKYDAEKGTVRGFLKGMAHRRMVDLLRQKTSQRKMVTKILERAVGDDLLHPHQPQDAIISREAQAEVSTILKEVMSASEKLTPLRKRAFRSRFLETSGLKWAKKLEEETGISAKTWRKYSDSGLNRVRKIVTNSLRKEAS